MICFNIFVLVFFRIFTVSAQTCEIIPFVSELLNNVPSEVVQKSADGVQNLHQCARMCTESTKCQSFAYERGQATCSIYYVDSVGSLGLLPTPAVYYADKSSWQKGPCVNHNCAPEELCLPVPTGFICRRKNTKCFTMFQPPECFEEFEGYGMFAGEEIAYEKQKSLHICVHFCLTQNPAYKALTYDESNNCNCYIESVLGYELSIEPLALPVQMMKISIYDRIV